MTPILVHDFKATESQSWSGKYNCNIRRIGYHKTEIQDQ
jgi:hypothetical protein